MVKRRSHGDGALFKLKGRDLWRGVVVAGYDDSGKPLKRYVHARSQRECRDRLEALKAEIAEHGAPLEKSITLSQWATTWLETVAKPDVDPSTYAGYSSIVRRWIIPTIGRKKVAALKPSDVRALRQAMTGAGRATSTVRQGHIVLSMILDAARAERLCATNVARDVRKPGARRDLVRAERGALTAPQIIRILQTADGMADGARWWFKIFTGMRQGEILGARLADLDLAGHHYQVQWKLEDLRRDHGCGDEPCRFRRGADCPAAVWRVPDDFEREHLTGAWHLTRPKSRTGRIVPLLPQLVERLERWVAADRPNPHGLVFPDPDGLPILPRDDAQQWRNLLVRSGVIDESQAGPGGTELTGHWTRHTVVTVLASAGYDFQIIGEIVGHSTAQVTAMYRHAREEEKREAMAALGQAWGGAFGALPQIEG